MSQHPIDAMKQARSLYEITGDIKDINSMLVPRTDLRTAIEAAEKQEPVGVVHHKPTSVPGADYEQVAVFTRALEPGTKLYTTPPAALGQEPLLTWTEVREANKEIRYNHCIAKTEFGRFLLTWKGWKEDDWPNADETPWGEDGGCWPTLEEAKAACEAEYFRRLCLATPPAAQPAPVQEPVLEVVNGQINRSWDAIPAGFTGLLYMQSQSNVPPKKPKEPWYGSARVDDYNRGWNDCIDSINATPQPSHMPQPLTDEQIGQIIEQCRITMVNYCSDYKQTEFARAVEAAHGITGEPK